MFVILSLFWWFSLKDCVKTSVWQSGIAESNLAEQDDVGDDISAVKLMYTIIERWNLLLLVAVGSKVIATKYFNREDGQSEEDLLRDPDKSRALLCDCLKKDPYLEEKMPKLKMLIDINTDALECAEDADKIAEIEADLQGTLTDVKTLIGAMRRSMKAGPQ